jgi:hypothetical protein
MKQLFYNKNTGDRIQNRVISYVLYTVSCILIILSFAGLLNTYDKETETVIVLGKASYTPYQDEYEQMLYPTVRINTPSGTGSGVIFETTDSHRLTQIFILTACHVVDKENIVKIELYNSTIITGTVVITDTVKDLALIKPQINTRPNQPDRLPARPLSGWGLAGDRKVGQADFTDKIYTARLADKNYIPYLFSPVWAVGCSLGLPPRPSYGHLCAFAVNNWEISAPVLPGNSGGPVYDARTFEVIGIAVWVKVYQYQLITTMAGIVPIGEIYEFLNHKDTKNTK